ncbi:hemerythrin domain-containing protein [Streptomyces sp. NPDC059991]|uniref:hemerythrin domain-containing protein n=1 Tax=Streptomyces sp. NPDC059991 TaxID=3347028 RepID=UPI003697A4DD
MNATEGRDQPDLTLMYATHDAFRRDLGLLAAAARGNGTAPGSAFRTGWETFQTFLTIHHTAEDKVLWPLMRAKLADDPERLRLLDEMDAEHEALDPLLDAVEDVLAQQQAERLPGLIATVAETLVHHLDHEEQAALPVVQSVLSAPEYDTFGAEQRRMLGVKGGALYFPWVLDGASEETQRTALGVVPPPVRFLYRAVWRPRYQKRTRAFSQAAA